MNGYLRLLHPDQNSAATTLIQPGRSTSLENITQTFLKCIRWQVEETTDPINCPYHYYCDSSYPGEDYSPIVDILVLLFTATLYLVTLVFTVQEIILMVTTFTNRIKVGAGRGDTGDDREVVQHDARYYCSGGDGSQDSRRRYWLPSGPIILPFILLTLAKGHRINTVFSFTPCIGPALLQVLHISALAFEINNNNAATLPAHDMLYINIKYVLFELSTVSGILHASLYLDSIILPYYTGLDALLSSTSFSGECPSCVCRNEVLVVGGRLVSYRGWSLTMFSVIAVLCWRIICRLLLFHYGDQADRSVSTNRNYVMADVVVVLQVIIKPILETMSWIFIAIDCIYLMMNSPTQIGDGSLLETGAAYGCACVLICLHFLKKLQYTCTIIRSLAQWRRYKKMSQLILKLASLGK